MPARPAGCRLVTLTSDIGWVYAAQMKAVLAARVRADRIFDLAHDLPPHAIREDAFLFRAMAERFPSGSVHVCVVDPGVGGPRAAVVVRCKEGSFLVGPDNGVLFPLAERLGVESVVKIDAARVALPGRVGATFDGRDLFAPAAARLAGGESLTRLGTRWRLRPLTIPTARQRGSEVVGEILHADRFGNLITNVPPAALAAAATHADVKIGHHRLRDLRFVRTYEELGHGRLGLLLSSFGLIELSVCGGNAARRLRARPGDRLVLTGHSGTSVHPPRTRPRSQP